MSNVYVISAVRTPIGKFGGELKDVLPVDLAATVMQSALDRSGIQGADLDLYIFGNVLGAGHGQLLPRQAALKAGIPSEVDGLAVNMVCSSGMMSIMQACAFIQAGQADLILAGGVESMSTTGFFLSSKARWGYKLIAGNADPVVDLLMFDGLTDPVTGESMGVETERLAKEYGVTRQEVDEVALMSHRRALETRETVGSEGEITPVEIVVKGQKRTILLDEGVRPDISMEALAALRPAFDREGILTAGNSSQISDGAAALVLAGEETVRRLGLKTVARVIGSGWSALETWRFAEAPVPAVQKMFERTGLSLDDVDLFENNEAFAVSSILFSRRLGIGYDRLNVSGGAVALGHPIGASGARITATLIHSLIRRDRSIGVAAICHGTGGGTAIAFERT